VKFAANLELKQLKEELGSLDFELKKKNAENIQLKEEKKSLEYEVFFFYDFLNCRTLFI
jgi:hypothetical protein